MTSFIAFTLAVLLGLVLSQAVPDAKPDAPGATPTIQSDFIYNSNQLPMSWDNVTLAANAASCLLY
jgi:hypothetical protein